MTVNAVSSKCPFLTRVPSNFLSHAGSSLNMYGQRCPVMARLFHRAATGQGGTTTLGTRTLTLGEFELVEKEELVVDLPQLSMPVC